MSRRAYEFRPDPPAPAELPRLFSTASRLRFTPLRRAESPSYSKLASHG
jgi:hypothetical protein